MSVEEWIALFFLWVLGTIAGLVITGLLADRLVIRKIFRNKEVQDTINVFREGRDYLKKLLEETKKNEQQGN